MSSLIRQSLNVTAVQLVEMCSQTHGAQRLRRSTTAASLSLSSTVLLLQGDLIWKPPLNQSWTWAASSHQGSETAPLYRDLFETMLLCSCALTSVGKQDQSHRRNQNRLLCQDWQLSCAVVLLMQDGHIRIKGTRKSCHPFLGLLLAHLPVSPAALLA